MTWTLSMVAPGKWRSVSAGADRDAEIAAAVDEVFASADRDSSAADKHWMRQRLAGALDGVGEAGGRVVSVAFPTQPVGGTVLPVTATVLALETSSETMEDALKALAAVAAADPSAKPLPTSAGLALRTHRVSDVKESFDAEVEQAPIEPEMRREIQAASSAMPMLRARYLFPAAGAKQWHAVSFSATLGTDEPDLVTTYLELFDAFAETVTWKEQE